MIMAVELNTNSIEHHAFLLNYLASSYEKEEHLDLTFVCKGGKVIKAHQLVLASVSRFLRELFNESTTPEVSISLSEVDDRLLSQLLTLMYEGTLKLLASDAREFQELIEMLGIKFPGDMYINPSPPSLYTSQNGIDEVSSSSAMAIIAMDSVKEFLGKSTVGGPSDDPLNIPDRYFVKPKAGGTGQPNVKPVQPKPAGHKVSTSEKISNRMLREVSASPSVKLSTEGRASHTGASDPSTETSATNEGTSHPGASSGSVHNEAKSPTSDSVGRSDPGGLRKRKRATENAGEKLTRKKTRSKDKESNPT